MLSRWEYSTLQGLIWCGVVNTKSKNLVTVLLETPTIGWVCNNLLRDCKSCGAETAVLNFASNRSEKNFCIIKLLIILSITTFVL